MKTAFNSSSQDTLLASNLQSVYQDLGLDPLVNNLNLECHHPTMRVLTEATQASAASSLMALHQGISLHEEMASKNENGIDRMRPAVKTLVEQTPIRVRTNSKQDRNGSCADTQDSSQSVDGEDSSTSSSPKKSEVQANRLHELLAAVPGNDARRSSESRQHEAAAHIDSTPAASAPYNSTLDACRQKFGSVKTAYIAGSPLYEKDRNKGLRQFSLRVCRQVEAKTVTTYNEVADELVKEFRQEDRFACDEKNIRRRAYDALNVLTAMDIISKDKKHIQWRGFFNVGAGDGGCGAGSGGAAQQGGANAGVWSEKEKLVNQIHAKKKELREKEAQLEDLVLQYVSLKQLLRRNEVRRREQRAAAAAASAAASSSSPVKPPPRKMHKILLPFVIVQTDKDNFIECQISEDKHIADLSCEKPFELHDDKETLGMMRMYACAEADLRQMLPDPLLSFITQRRPDIVDGSAPRKRTAEEALSCSESDDGEEDEEEAPQADDDDGAT